MDTTVIWVVFACFLAVLIGITLWSRHESNSMSGYYVAGKHLPWWVVAGEVIGIALSWMVEYYGDIMYTESYLIAYHKVKAEKEKIVAVQGPSYFANLSFDKVVHLLNLRPRKRVNYQTPFEVFNKVTHGALAT